jgi:hypothetical protein
MKNINHHDFVNVHEIMFSNKTFNIMNSFIVCFDDVFETLSTNLKLNCFVRTKWSFIVEILSLFWRYLTYDAVLIAFYISNDHLLFVITNEIDQYEITSSILKINTFHDHVVRLDAIFQRYYRVNSRSKATIKNFVVQFTLSCIYASTWLTWFHVIWWFYWSSCSQSRWNRIKHYSIEFEIDEYFDSSFR